MMSNKDATVLPAPSEPLVSAESTDAAANSTNAPTSVKQLTIHKPASVPSEEQKSGSTGPATLGSEPSPPAGPQISGSMPDATRETKQVRWTPQKASIQQVSQCIGPSPRTDKEERHLQHFMELSRTYTPHMKAELNQQFARERVDLLQQKQRKPPEQRRLQLGEDDRGAAMSQRPSNVKRSEHCANAYDSRGVYHVSLCNWSGSAVAFAAHRLVCPSEPIPCSKCGKIRSRRLMTAHRLSMDCSEPDDGANIASPPTSSNVSAQRSSRLASHRTLRPSRQESMLNSTSRTEGPPVPLNRESKTDAPDSVQPSQRTSGKSRPGFSTSRRPARSISPFRNLSTINLSSRKESQPPLVAPPRPFLATRHGDSDFASHPASEPTSPTASRKVREKGHSSLSISQSQSHSHSASPLPATRFGRFGADASGSREESPGRRAGVPRQRPAVDSRLPTRPRPPFRTDFVAPEPRPHQLPTQRHRLQPKPRMQYASTENLHAAPAPPTNVQPRTNTNLDRARAARAREARQKQEEIEIFDLPDALSTIMSKSEARRQERARKSSKSSTTLGGKKSAQAPIALNFEFGLIQSTTSRGAKNERTFTRGNASGATVLSGAMLDAVMQATSQDSRSKAKPAASRHATDAAEAAARAELARKGAGARISPQRQEPKRVLVLNVEHLFVQSNGQISTLPPLSMSVSPNGAPSTAPPASRGGLLDTVPDGGPVSGRRAEVRVAPLSSPPALPAAAPQATAQPPNARPKLEPVAAPPVKQKPNPVFGTTASPMLASLPVGTSASTTAPASTPSVVTDASTTVVAPSPTRRSPEERANRKQQRKQRRAKRRLRNQQRKERRAAGETAISDDSSDTDDAGDDSDTAPPAVAEDPAPPTADSEAAPAPAAATGESVPAAADAPVVAVGVSVLPGTEQAASTESAAAGDGSPVATPPDSATATEGTDAGVPVAGGTPTEAATTQEAPTEAAPAATEEVTDVPAEVSSAPTEAAGEESKGAEDTKPVEETPATGAPVAEEAPAAAETQVTEEAKSPDEPAPVADATADGSPAAEPASAEAPRSPSPAAAEPPAAPAATVPAESGSPSEAPTEAKNEAAVAQTEESASPPTATEAPQTESSSSPQAEPSQSQAQPQPDVVVSLPLVVSLPPQSPTAAAATLEIAASGPVSPTASASPTAPLSPTAPASPSALLSPKKKDPKSPSSKQLKKQAKVQQMKQLVVQILASAKAPADAGVVIAQNDWVPRSFGDLMLARGDVIHVIQRSSNGWWSGVKEKDATVGIFPAAVVEDLPPEMHHALDAPGAAASALPEPVPEPEYVKAHTAFPDAREGELPLLKGDVIEVFSRKTDSDGWWRGRNFKTLAEGLFPSIFVSDYQLTEC